MADLSATTERGIYALPEATESGLGEVAPSTVLGLDLDKSIKIATALGSRVFDTAGRAYIDLCMGHGSLLLGHNAAPIKQAVQKQLDASWVHGYEHDLTDRVATMISALGPANERTRFCSSETEAITLAIAASRLTTGRQRVVSFTPLAHGADSNIVLRSGYGTTEALERLKVDGTSVAAVIVEPVPTDRPGLTHGAWLQSMQSLCNDIGAMLILNETTSGFRIAYGGAQEFFKLRPDLVIYGNALGGGMPIGVLSGRTAVMSIFGGGTTPPRVFCSSTHAGNPLSAAAAEAVLQSLAMHRETVYPQLRNSAETIRTAFNNAATQRGVNARLYQAGSFFRIVWDDDITQPAVQSLGWMRFRREVMDRHVMIHRDGRCFLSTAHTVADIGAVANAFAECVG